MLEKPVLTDEEIIDCLQVEFGLVVENLSFLPLGADLNTAVYRAVTDDKTAFFVKLRRGDFKEASITVPNYLAGSGIKQVIPSLTTQTGKLWADLNPFKVILYPFVEGRNGFARKLSNQQWVEFGAALKQFHVSHFPSAITNGIERENFSSQWRDTVKRYLERIEKEVFTEPVAVDLANFLKSKIDETLELIQRAGQFAQALRKQDPENILCHADIHGWNLLIDNNGALYIVDWDTLVFAPKERDLMFIGGGLGNSGYTPQEEEAMFYQGYGQTEINQIAIGYYRCERIIEDLAVYCEQIFLSDDGGEDRREALENVKSNFLPGGTIEVAYQSASLKT
jgi:spectinomycin phosphotransferase